MRWLALIALFALVAPAALPAAHATNIGDPGNLLVKVSSGVLVEYDGDSGALLGTFLNANPNDFAFGGSILYTTDPSDQLVAYDAQSGAVIDVLAGPALIRNAGSVSVAPDGSIVVLNQISGDITLDHFSPSGAFLGIIISAPINDFVFGPNGNIYATTSIDEVIEIRASDGVVQDVLTSAVVNPGPLLFLGDGSLLVRDAAGVQQFSELGVFLGTFTSTLANDLVLGLDGNIYASDPSDVIMGFDGISGTALGVFAVTGANPSALAFRPVPEPAAVLLFAASLTGLALRTRSEHRTQ